MYAIPQEIRLNKTHDTLTLVYPDRRHELPAEYLRVYSPSAEVRGHGAGQETLQTGKRGVLITDLESIGNYALKITFSDGHDSGLYDWGYLDNLGNGQAELWPQYLAKLAMEGASRDPNPAAEAAQKTAHTHSGCGGCAHSKH